jgi:hypothetical protein
MSTIQRHFNPKINPASHKNYLGSKRLDEGNSFGKPGTELKNEKSKTVLQITYPEHSVTPAKTRIPIKNDSDHEYINRVLFDDSHNVRYDADNKVIGLNCVSQKEEQKLYPFIVTECLSTHQECTQEYTDINNSFRIRCFCRCHCKDSKRQHKPLEGEGK